MGFVRRILVMIGAVWMVLSWGVAQAADSTIDIVRLNPGHSEFDKRTLYTRALLERVMATTEAAFGAYRFEVNSLHASRNRALQMLEEGTISVYEAPTNPSWEAYALPVRIPILKGILGYKVFLIRSWDADTFKSITSMAQLQRIPMGQGAQWSSTAVFEANAFRVDKVSDYESLFTMLAVGRFDYFPRSLHEILPEYENRKDQLLNLAVEQHLALYMPLPVYFFVSPDQSDLQTRLRAGMDQMLADGSFDQLFFDYHQQDLVDLQLDQRRIFTMDNPFLTPETPLDDQRLWYQPGTRSTTN